MYVYLLHIAANKIINSKRNKKRKHIRQQYKRLKVFDFLKKKY